MKYLFISLLSVAFLTSAQSHANDINSELNEIKKLLATQSSNKAVTKKTTNQKRVKATRTPRRELNLHQMNGQIDFQKVQQLIADPKFQIQMQNAMNIALPMVQKMQQNGQIEQLKSIGQAGALGMQIQK